MAINKNRQTITYENIAMFQSTSPAHSGINNSGANLSFLPFVQNLNFSFDVPLTNVGNLGTKSFIDQSSFIQPDVNLSVNTIETFENLFSGLFTGSGIRDDLNTDRNFYAVLGDKKSFDISGINLSGAEVLSFGNCFLNDVTISQSVNGLMTSQYSYVGSNMEAQKLTGSGVKMPSVNLTGNQSQNLTGFFSGISEYYSNSNEKIIPFFKTNLNIINQDFIAQSDAIQEFSIQMPINRKTIYGLGKKFPIARKALFPNECVINISNLLSSFQFSDEKSNLKKFLNSNQTYNLSLSGTNNAGSNFISNNNSIRIKNAKLVSQSYTASIGSDFAVDLAFTFELNDFVKAPSVLQDEDVISFVYDGNTYTKTNSTVNGKSTYRRFDEALEVTFQFEYNPTVFNDLQIGWVINNFQSIPSSNITVGDTEYPWRLTNGTLRNDFSNLSDS